MSRLKIRDGVTCVRAAFLGAAAFCSAMASSEQATAADWPALRGSLSPGYTRWDGWQAGVQVGLGNMNTDFGNSTSPLVAFILRNTTLENEAAPSNWTTLPSNTTNGPVFGAFVGYNIQWSELVLGFDLAYKHPSNLNASTSDSLSRRFTTSVHIHHDVTIAAQSSFKLLDYATLRARAGYAFGQFLPYAVIGAAAGRFTYLTSVSVTDTMTLTVPPPPVPQGTFQQSASQGQDNVVVGGVVGGLGLDWAITQSVFLRAEWEFIAFAPINGTRTNINTGSVGIGVHF